MNSDIDNSIEQLRDLVLAALDQLKAKDICVLDVRGRTSIADYMIIATGTSGRHAKSIADNVVTAAREAGFTPLGMEGEGTSEWVLADLGDVIVHVMQQQARDFYNLEKLWEAPRHEDVLASLKRA